MEEIQDVIVGEYTSTSYEHSQENTPLMGGKTRKPRSDWLRRIFIKYGRSRKCVSSKAALLILVWNFVVAFVSALTLNPDIYFRLLIVLGAYGCAAFLFCFFPMPGLLADLKYGCYKTVVYSLLLIFISVITLTVIGVIILLVSIA